ncbi:RodZ domain-containing protein [uncultured Nisaea sp.]|uniref:RodZ domain-containing protein n=1 Tax=uncultured Nisaea sp. TaxID=538215 RepID=UPI0030EECE7E|tara:strand:- start:403 stop:1833 length:1431 start_codon:yes stop_codon:yes gene_type:complete
MSAKAKLRLRHIEDAAQSKTATTTPRVAAVKAVASPSIAVKTAPPAPAEQIQLSQAEYGSTVGEMLQRHRIERDLTLQDIAQQLRIQRSYLDALENGDFDKLPGLTYAIGYVRSYAQLLELDAATLITDFKAEAKKLQEPTQLSFPSPAPEGKVPGGALVFVGVLLAALSYGGWYYFSTSETSVSDLTPKIPDRLAFLLEEPAIDSPAAAETAPATLQPMASAATPAPTLRAPASSTEASSTGQAAQTTSDDTAPKPAADPALQANTPDTASAPETVVAAAETAVATSAATEIPAAPSGSNAVVASSTETTPAPVTAPEAAVSEAPPAAEQIASVPASAPAPAPEAADIPDVPDMPRPEAASTGRSVAEAEAAALDTRPQSVSTASSTGPLIVISATDDSWVQVRGTDATPLLTRILRKGEEYKVPVRTGLKLFTGNAGALKISVNGAQAPSLGPFGKIARNIPLDESLLTYTVAD